MAESEFNQTLERARVKLAGARLARPTPKIDTTIYAGWNGMMVSAWLEAAHVLGRPDCRAFAMKTLDRLLAEGWRDDGGFGHFLGAPRTAGLLDDHVFAGLALLDAFEDTLDRRYFDAARRTAARLLDHFYDRQAGGFFDRPDDAPPLGGFDIRRKPFQDSPSPGANSGAAVLCDRLSDYTGEAGYREAAERTLEAFSGVIDQYGMFAASYGLALVMHQRRPMEVVIAGGEGDLAAYELQQAAYSVYRFGKAVLRVTPQAIAAGSLPPGLAETLGQLRADRPLALVCVENTCHPPVIEPEELAALLKRAGAPPRAAE